MPPASSASMATRSRTSKSSSLMVSQEGYVPPTQNKTVKQEPAASPGDDDEDDFVDVDGEAEGLLADAEGVPIYSDGGFKIRQVTLPSIVQRTLGDLYELSKTPYLKLDPEYQRDVVWDEARSSGLIASVLQGYFIPPIIFNVNTEIDIGAHGMSRTERHYRICVDGKQRLTSIGKFMEGKIGVMDSSRPPKKWFFCHPIVDGVETASAHTILPDATKEFFKNRTFCCYEYHALPPSVEETMFQLVQRGMPLTPAEKMRALSTPWANFARQYEVDYPMVIALCTQKRASGFRLIVTIFSQIMEVQSPSGDRRKDKDGAGSTPTLQSGPNVLMKLLINTRILNEAVKKIFKKVFDKYQELVDLCSDPSEDSATGFKIRRDTCFATAPAALTSHGVFHVKTFSPLEVVVTAILLLMHMDKRNNRMLMDDIMDMRVYLRQVHRDLRLNGACWATAYKYIDVDLVLRRGGEGATRRREAAGERRPDRSGAPRVIDEDTVIAEASRQSRAPVASMTGQPAQPAQPVNHDPASRRPARSTVNEPASTPTRSWRPTAGAQASRPANIHMGSFDGADDRHVSFADGGESSGGSGRVRTSDLTASLASGQAIVAERSRFTPSVQPRKRTTVVGGDENARLEDRDDVVKRRKP